MRIRPHRVDRRQQPLPTTAPDQVIDTTAVPSGGYSLIAPDHPVLPCQDVAEAQHPRELDRLHEGKCNVSPR
jgi:hypothetical protein